MHDRKILITPRSFGKKDDSVFKRLEEAGFAPVRNTSGRIFTKDEMIEAIADCEGLIVGVDPVDRDVLAAAPKLRAIAKYGTGVDNIDLEEAARRGIPVSRTIGANSDAVADYTFALILALARKVPLIDRQCRQNRWEKIITTDVTGATLGILGFGEIGRRLAKRAAGFEMQMLVYDPFWKPEWETQYPIRRSTPEEIFSQADFISLHMPLLPETRHFVDAAMLSRMKSTAYLINAARGELVEEAALLDALKNGRIAGAGVDAFAQEPPENPLWFTLDNVILGSHCAASTQGAAQNMGRIATENLLRDLQKSV